MGAAVPPDGETVFPGAESCTYMLVPVHGCLLYSRVVYRIAFMARIALLNPFPLLSSPYLYALETASVPTNHAVSPIWVFVYIVPTWNTYMSLSFV